MPRITSSYGGNRPSPTLLDNPIALLPNKGALSLKLIAVFQEQFIYKQFLNISSFSFEILLSHSAHN